MTTTTEILDKAGKSFVDKLKQEFNFKGLNDTRAAQNSISFKSNDSKLEIEGLLRVVVLQDGRAPGKFPPMGIIESWVRRKLNVEESQVKSTAFLIARKIAKKGTNIFTDKAKGLQIELIIEELNNDLFGEISNQAALSVSDSIFNAYK